MKKERLLRSRKLQHRDHALGTQSKAQRHQVEQWLWKQITSLAISVVERVTT